MVISSAIGTASEYSTPLFIYLAVLRQVFTSIQQRAAPQQQQDLIDADAIGDGFEDSPYALHLQGAVPAKRH